MKITTQEICQMLKEQDGKNWSLCFGDKRVFFCGKSDEKDLSEVNTCISISFYLPSIVKISSKDFRALFSNLNWKEIYDNSIVMNRYTKNKWQEEKFYILDEKDFHFSFMIPKRIVKLIENKLTKTAEGRGGK